MSSGLIAAAATAWGRSAVGIVRLSGEGAAECAGGVFFPADGRPLWEHEPRTLVYGTLREREGKNVDKVLATWSPAPHSYTGEETAELQCHGSPVVLTLASLADGSAYLSSVLLSAGGAVTLLGFLLLRIAKDTETRQDDGTIIGK